MQDFPAFAIRDDSSLYIFKISLNEFYIGTYPSILNIYPGSVFHEVRSCLQPMHFRLTAVLLFGDVCICRCRRLKGRTNYHTNVNVNNVFIHTLAVCPFINI